MFGCSPLKSWHRRPQAFLVLVSTNIRSHIIKTAKGAELAMTTFDERENAFENKFAFDSELQFKAEARRNKLIGLWAANLLGKTRSEADAYALDVIRSDFERPGDEDVLQKLTADLQNKASESTIRSQLEAFMIEAKEQISNDE